MYSERISDPAFARYIKNTNRWSALFAAILAVVAVVGSYLAGEKGWSELENPDSLYHGLVIGGMFLLIALFQIWGRQRSWTWDGQVVEKLAEQKRRRRSSGDDSYVERVWLYTVLIRSDLGKLHRITAENDDTVYNYYAVGDRVRHHGGLRTFEKLDKSRDTVIFCNACSTQNDIQADYCSRCHCPLLK